MARLKYVVGFHNNQWKVIHGGYPIRTYATQKEAMQGAVDLAHSAGRSGHDVQVLVQGTDSKFRTEWTYGHDPYPLRG
jgi:hypothetical protein